MPLCVYAFQELEPVFILLGCSVGRRIVEAGDENVI
jgi:hypothetical protein